MEQVAYAIEEQVNDTYEHELEDQPNLTVAHANIEEASLVARLRRGDETAFTLLVERHHASLIRLAMCHVPDRSIAEEVVQETWLALLEGLDRFEGRSSLKTWLYRILINKAKDRGVREHRSVPFSPTGHDDLEADESAVDPSRFLQSGPRTDHWAEAPGFWDANTPERLLLCKETGVYLEKAIAALPPAQRLVLAMHDIEDLSFSEICNILGISQTNGYVLLHRARSRVRATIERYLEGSKPALRAQRRMVRANASATS